MYLESRGLKIVVADADRAVLEMLQIRLDLAGHETHIARTAPDAIEMVRSLRPSVLILDLQLPPAGGMSVLESLNQRYNRLPLPAVVLSRQLAAGDIQKAVPLGARDCIAKPFSGADIVERVARVLKKFPPTWGMGGAVPPLPSGSHTQHV